MEGQDWLAELAALARPGSFDELAPFRETLLALLADPRLREELRTFGRLLARFATEAPGPPSTPAVGWHEGLVAALADLRFVTGHLACLCRDFLATEPAGSARHRDARAAGRVALELAGAADRLAALTGHGQAVRKPRPKAPEAAA